MSGVLQEYLPWILLSILGMLLMIIAGKNVLIQVFIFKTVLVPVLCSEKQYLYLVTLMGSGYRPHVTVIPMPVSVSVPAFEAEVKVTKVHGQRIRYVKDLRSMGTLSARSLRYKLEPKVVF